MKKFLALVLCLAMVLSMGIVAFADETTTGDNNTGASTTVETKDDENKAEAKINTTVEKKTPTEKKTAADYYKEMKDATAATTWSSPVVDYAKGAKAAWEAGLAASKAYLALSDAYAKFGKDVLTTTQSAASAAIKAALGSYVNTYKGIVNQVISLEFQDAAMKVSNEMEKAIAEFQIGFEDAIAGISGYDITASVDVSALLPTTEFSYVPMQAPAEGGASEGGSGSGETPAPTTEG